MSGMKPSGGFSVMDWNDRTGRFEERKAGRGAYYDHNKQGGFGRRNDPPSRLADDFGRGEPSNYRGAGRGFGGGAKKIKGLGRLGRGLARLSPVGRALDLGFQLLDLWQVTQPEDPFFHGPGWELFCETGPGPYTDFRNGITRNASDCAINLGCGTVLQITSGEWKPGSSVSVDYPGGSCFGSGAQTRAASIAFGPGTGEGASRRMDFHRVYRACWSRACPTFGQPGDPGPIRYLPRVVQPMPATLAPPKPAPDPEGRPFPRPADKPRTGLQPAPKPTPDPDTPVEPKPGGGVDVEPPPGTPVVPDKPGRTKVKFRDPGVGDFYGRLTEMKDALKCVEKNIKGHRPKGGLHERIAAAALAMYYEPNRVNRPGIVQCLIANHIEDAVIGKANQLANKITKSPYWVRPVGPGAGTWATRI